MGLQAAKFEFILTCDDDNWLFPNYITRAYQLMAADPKLGALGGLGIYEPELPLKKEIERFSNYFVNGPQAWANTEHWVYGAGSVYRKSILTNLIGRGWQQITSGRKGKSLICGEDVEICFMIYLNGYKIMADEELKFKHFIPLKRQKIAYITDLSFWLSYSHVLMNSYYPIINGDQRPIRDIMNNWFFGATKSYLKNVILLIYKKTKVWEKRTVEEKILFNSNYGIWYGLYKNRALVINHHEHIKKLLNTETLKPAEYI